MLKKIVIFTFILFSFRLGAFEIIVSDAYRDAVYRMVETNGSGVVESDSVSVIYNDDAEGPDLSTPADMVLVNDHVYLLDGGSLDTVFRFIDRDSEAGYFFEGEAEVFYGPGCEGIKLRTPKCIAYRDGVFAIADDSGTRPQILLLRDLDDDGNACLFEENVLFYDSKLIEGEPVLNDPETLCILADYTILAADATTGNIFRLEDRDGDGLAVADDEISLFYTAPAGDNKPVFSCIISYKNGFLASDSNNGGVLYLEDKNGDKTVSEGEASSFCGHSGSSVYLGEPTDLWIDDLGNVWIVDNATDLVYFVSDWNQDGDACDAGEVLPVLKDGSILSRPVSIVVKGAPQGSAPLVKELSINSGSMTGGEEILVKGESFSEGVMVFFGDIPAMEVEVVDVQNLRVITPAGSGKTPVTVASINGISVLENSWTFTGDVFSVSNIQPAEGDSEGGYLMTIDGNGLDDAIVWFDGIQAEVSKKEKEELVVIVPVHEAGEITVLIGNGSREVTFPFLYTKSVPLFIRGDVDADGSIVLNDAILILSYLFSSDAAKYACEDTIDANDDGSVNLADAIYLLSYLFSGGKQPPLPFPEPGEDTTPDDLSCFGLETF